MNEPTQDRAERPSIDDVIDHIRLFIALRDGGHLEQAMEYGEHILEAVPNIHIMWVELGRIQKKLGLFDRAIESFKTAVAFDSGSIPALLMLSHAILERIDYHDMCVERGYGEAAWSRRNFSDTLNFDAITIDDNILTELFNVGLDLNNSGHFHEGIQCFQHILSYNPRVIHAYYALSCAILTLGRFQEARPLMLEWLVRSPRGLPFPIWQGESLEDKTLYVFADHGLGDMMQFVCYIPIVARHCRKLVFGLPSSLWKIIGPIDNVEMVTELSQSVDYMCSLFALPHAVGIDADAIPSKVPYLEVDPSLVASWGERLPRGGLRIGIAWQGNPSSSLDAGRSMPVACFAPVARIPGVTLVSLQVKFGLDQLERLPEGMSVMTLGPDFNAGPDNVVDTAAVMRNLDLIISTDTSVPHIAGALGCPVWTVLKAIPDWRWMLERTDSPWYPTMRLFRQKTPGDWSEVMAQVAGAVSEVLETRALTAPGS